MIFYQSKKTLTDADGVSVRISAMDMLARREHSFFELCSKLEAKGASSDLSFQVVNELKCEGLQSDFRFVESYISSWAAKGRGLQKILSELNRHHLPSGLVSSVLDELNLNWFDHAIEAYKKKYGDFVPDDYNERAKRMRFLQNRGFEHEQIYSALEQIKCHHS